jgi:transposase
MSSLKAELDSAADDVLDAEFVLSEKRRKRDELIVACAADGMSLRAIADSCLVSHQTIANILERARGVAAGGVTTTTPEAGRTP